MNFKLPEQKLPQLYQNSVEKLKLLKVNLSILEKTLIPYDDNIIIK